VAVAVKGRLSFYSLRDVFRIRENTDIDLRNSSIVALRDGVRRVLATSSYATDSRNFNFNNKVANVAEALR
jgi:hypothetical protein